jgi:hypothetical protein
MLAEVELIAPCPPLTSWHKPEMTKSAMNPRLYQVLLQSSTVMDCATPALQGRRRFDEVSLELGLAKADIQSLPESRCLLVEYHSSIWTAIDDRGDL